MLSGKEGIIDFLKGKTNSNSKVISHFSKTQGRT